MPPGSPRPGDYSAQVTPYVIEPTSEVTRTRYKIIVIIMGTQMGKTSGLMNVCGRKLDDDPAHCLWIGPTMSNLESVIEPEFERMILGCESLKEKLLVGRGARRMLKNFGDVTMRFAWAGSATEVASQPAHTVIVDERDKMLPIPGEGDVVVLAEARKQNYADGVVLVTSSPTEGNVETEIHPETGLEHWAVAEPEDILSPIWKLWQSGTRHEWAVQCPHCAEYFVPRFKLLRWPEGASPVVAKRKAVLHCGRCDKAIEDRYRAQLAASGMYLSPGQRVVGGVRVGEPIESEIASYWVSGLNAPFVTFGQRAEAWVRAARSHDQETIRATINTAFGELYRVRGEAPPWEEIEDISVQSTYQLGEMPRGVRKIFLTVDVQKDHLVYVIRGWGVEMTSWLIDRGDIWGDPAQLEVWSKLDDLVDKPFPGGRLLDAYAVDSGYQTDMVYAWCGKRLSRAYATKGKDAPQKLYAASDVEVMRDGKKKKTGLKLWTFDDPYFKSWVHDRLRWDQAAPGAWHLPRAIGADYCKQIVAEQRMRLPSGRILWVKSSVNDFLDCEKLQVLVARLEGVQNLPPDDSKPPPAPRGRGVRSSGVKL